jgi:hypothetical protein
MHGRLIPGPWDDLVVHRTEAHPSLLKRLGTPDALWDR